MKKKIVVLNVVGLILMALGVAGFMLGPWFFGLRNGTPFYTYTEIFANIPALFTGLFNFNVQNQGFIMQIVVLSISAIAIILLIVHLIVLIVKKCGKSVLAWFAFLLGVAILIFMMLWILIPGNAGYYAAGASLTGKYALTGWFGVGFATFRGIILGYGPLRKAFALALIIGVVALIAVGVILMFIAYILELVKLGRIRKEKKAAADEEAEEIEVAEDGDVVAEEVDEEEKKEDAEAEDDGRYRPRPAEAQPMPAGIQGPLLVQYINTYAPEPGKKNAVPVSEIQDVVNGEKPLTADEVRKIIKEELASKEEAPAQPVIVSVPAPKKEEEPALTAEDVRKIFEEELRKAQPDEGDVVVEEEPVPGLTADEVRAIIDEALAEKPEEKPVEEETKEEQDVRAIIREELATFYGEKDAAEAARKAAEEEEARKAAEEEAARKAAEEEEAARKAAEEEARRQEIEEARRQAAEEARKAAEEEAARKAAEEEEARKAAEEAKKEEEALSAEEIRKIIADALAAEKPEEKPAEPAPEGLTADDIRDIIREELAGLVKEEPAPEPVVVEEKPAEPAPAPTVTVVVQAPEAKPEEKPEEPEEKGPAPERIPFPTRLLSSDEDVQENYNILKSEILAYGVKSRVSNTGDTFRLHKITYVKITVAGKGLKLYFALDPKDYADSKIPVSDAGHKGAYQDIPLVFKVKSDLSLRRAKQLIADVMAKFGNEKGEIEERDWAYALKDYGLAADDDD